MNPHEILDRIQWRIAKTTYVVVVKDGSNYNLIVDPGINRPWSTKQKKFADVVASECDGMTMTFEEAFKFLLKHNGGERALEKTLTDRIATAAKIKSAEYYKDATNPGTILDAKGKVISNGN